MTVPRRRAVAGLAVLVLCAAGCSGPDRRASEVAPDFLVENLGGTTSAREFRGRPFHQSARSLDNSEFARFGDGAVVFDADFTPEMGLGPTFNETSCLGCHTDTAQRRPADPLDPGPGRLVRLSVVGDTANGAPRIDPTYGLQLQDRSIASAEAEGRVDIEWTYLDGTYGDGTPYQLRRPAVTITNLSSGPLAVDAMTSMRIAPPILGLGLLEAIPESMLVAAQDPDDLNGDGISGRRNMVWDALAQQPTTGRFGWKAGQPNVRQQSADALHDDMGVTSADAPDPCANQGSACNIIEEAIEMTDTDFADQVFYNRTIAVPIARGVRRPEVIRGANRFVDTGCAACHTTTHRTGPDEVDGLADQTIHPFTDLLLHDMGDGLADGRPEFEASGREWRTPPLWGLGYRAEVTGSATLLHDGRARSMAEAVLWHGGEARRAQQAFLSMSAEDRADLLAFLHAL